MWIEKKIIQFIGNKARDISNLVMDWEEEELLTGSISR